MLYCVCVCVCSRSKRETNIIARNQSNINQQAFNANTAVYLFNILLIRIQHIDHNAKESKHYPKWEKEMLSIFTFYFKYE